VRITTHSLHEEAPDCPFIQGAKKAVEWGFVCEVDEGSKLPIKLDRSLPFFGTSPIIFDIQKIDPQPFGEVSADQTPPMAAWGTGTDSAFADARFALYERLRRLESSPGNR
jgi:hypothetical protein